LHCCICCGACCWLVLDDQQHHVQWLWLCFCCWACCCFCWLACIQVSCACHAAAACAELGAGAGGAEAAGWWCAGLLRVSSYAAAAAAGFTAGIPLTAACQDIAAVAAAAAAAGINAVAAVSLAAAAVLTASDCASASATGADNSGCLWCCGDCQHPLQHVVTAAQDAVQLLMRCHPRWRCLVSCLCHQRHCVWLTAVDAGEPGVLQRLCRCSST
jgi:hypothetical protein